MLTSQELVEKLKDLKYKVKFDEESINLYNPGTKYNIFCGFVHIHSHTYSFIGEIPREILLLVSEYMLTPFEKRGEVESKYYEVPLFDLVTSDGEQQYLTEKNGKYFASRKDDNLKQKFTKKELKKIPTVYKDFAVTIDEKEEIISD